MATDAIALVGKIVEIGKTLRDVGELVKDVKTKGLLADLNLAISDLKMQIVGLRDENLNLKEKLRKAHEQKELSGAIEVRDGAYWFTLPPPHRPAGPYCTACQDSKGALSLLRELPYDFQDIGTHQCPVCKATFGTVNS